MTMTPGDSRPSDSQNESTPAATPEQGALEGTPGTAADQSEAAFEAMFADNPLAIWIYDPETLRFLAVNRAAIATYGFSKMEFLKMKISEIRPPEDVPKLLDLVKTPHPGSRSGLRWRHRHKDGRIVDVQIDSNTVNFGPRRARLVVVRDITDNLNAERQQAAEEQSLRTSLEEARGSEQLRGHLLARVVNAQEQERRRIASTIHDDGVQLMTAVTLRLQTLKRHLTDPAQLEAGVELQDAVTAAIVRLRHLTFELDPPALERYGLAAALRVLLEQQKAETFIAYDIRDDLVTEPTGNTGIILYRISQEALANVAKHSRSNVVHVALENHKDGVMVSVQDEGIGMTVDKSGEVAAEHLGLEAMRERAEIAGGSWELEGAPGRGTTVRFWVPDSSPGGDVVTRG